MSVDSVGWLATLHLRHFSAVSSRSYGEWILHSKLHIPVPFVNHSAALARRIIFSNPLQLRASQRARSGLAMSKRIIEMHGCRVWVESQPGQGSTFAFTLLVIVERHVEAA
ncbi:MAG: ATP-binding protein [Xanthobacteraceae bacterium]